MSTGTEAETKKALDDTTWRRSLPLIDFKNEWLNKDRELYTLIILKTAIGVGLNTSNIALGSDTVEKSSLRSLGVVFSGLFETGMVSLNRTVIESAIGADNKGTAGLIAYDLTAGWILALIDLILNAKLLYLPVPAVFPVAQVADYVVNPLVQIYLPVAQVEQSNPNLQLVQKFVNGLNAITLEGGALGIYAGMITTQVLNTQQKGY
jgi:hypothetical protein